MYLKLIQRLHGAIHESNHLVDNLNEFKVEGFVVFWGFCLDPHLSAQRFQGAMKLTREHIAALNKFDQLANDPELYFSMQLEPGDMQFVYNHTQLHDRTGFEDWTEEGKQRLLLRLWLSVPGDRPLPPCFRERYGSIEIGNRGGIITRST